MLRQLAKSDAALSLSLHGLKVAVALLINWLVLNLFAIGDFVTWSVTSSILVVATASDLGIGQYTVTRLINTDRSGWTVEVGEGLAALIPLVVLAAVFVVLTIDGPSTSYKVSMGFLLAGRILSIPFAAALNAANQFKIRKAIELVAYLLAAAGVGAVAWMRLEIHWALMWLNLTFLLGATLTVAAAGRFVSIRGVLRFASVRRAVDVFRGAVPFMANNLTGLLAYGGFVWLASLVLVQQDLAKLAVLHGFVMVNLYQLYDVFLKARQADLIDARRVAQFRRLNWLVMAALPPLFLLLGREALALLGNPVAISTAEAALFGVFMSLELGNLFVQSIAQVNVALVRRLTTYSALRTLLLTAFVAAGLVTEEQAPLIVLLAMLTLVSMSAFLYLMRNLRLASQLAPNLIKRFPT